MNTLRQNLKFAARQLRRNPGFTVTVIPYACPFHRNGAPLPRATVQLNEALTAFSQQDGNYSIPNVPFGS